ncbi:MAG: type I 3-dehydroquinate dehydratase [Magnetococcus sp. WYHC-3]
MKPALGSLTLGTIPRVAGTITDRATLSLPASDLAAQCDLVELRLDLVGTDTPDWLQSCLALEASGLPVLLTLRLAAEGGKWQQADKLRERFLRSALDAISAIDVELNSDLSVSLGEYAARKNKTVIVSHHNFSLTPPLAELRAVVARIRRLPNAVPKIATMVNTEADIRILTDLLLAELPNPICVIGMGAAGAPTRTAFPAMGSCLTYGHLDKSSAPGQLSAAALVKALQKSIPAYKRDFAARKKPA